MTLKCPGCDISPLQETLTPDARGMSFVSCKSCGCYLDTFYPPSDPSGGADMMRTISDMQQQIRKLQQRIDKLEADQP